MKRKILGFLLVTLLIGLAIGSYFTFGNYSDGYRTGTVMKISKKGVMFKTWEGQLNVGSLQDANNDGTATTTWDFSVTDDSILTDLEKAVDNNHRVKLYYKEKFYQFDWLGDTKYFVYKVEEIE